MQNINNLINLRYVRQKHPFHLVNRSPWPFFGSMAAISLTIGAVLYMHRYSTGGSLLFWGVIFLVTVILFWFRDVILEATFEGNHTKKVQYGLRFGMKLFILSEVMFFFAFFWAFFHAALAPHTFLGVMWPPKGIIPMYVDGWVVENNSAALQTAFQTYIEVYKWISNEFLTAQTNYTSAVLTEYLSLPINSISEKELKNINEKVQIFTLLSVVDKDTLEDIFFGPAANDANYQENMLGWMIDLGLHNKSDNILENINSFENTLLEQAAGVGYGDFDKNWNNLINNKLPVPFVVDTLVQKIDQKDSLPSFSEWKKIENPYLLLDTPHWVKISGCASKNDDGFRYAFCYIPMFNPYSIPLAATFILLSSGVTLHTAGLWFKFANVKSNWPINTTARTQLGKIITVDTNNRIAAHKWVTFWLSITIGLGIIFTFIQSYEYFVLLPFGINDSVFGSCFYLLTGFHGFHVILGTVGLIICLIRHIKMHFTSTIHVGFECAAWYWHFVDGVWLFVYSILYWWSAPLKQPYLWFNETDENGSAIFFSCGQTPWTWNRMVQENEFMNPGEKHEMIINSLPKTAWPEIIIKK